MLPPVGECPACATAKARPPAVPAVPSLLDRDLRLDRRAAERDEAPTIRDADFVPPSPPPSVAPLAGPLPPPAAPRAAAPQQQPGVKRPTPPGMTPAARPAPAHPAVAAPRAAPPPPAAQPAWAQGGGAFAADVPPPPPPAQPSLSPLTPAYGTPPAARALAAHPLPGVASPAPGLPRTAAPAPAPGLPRMESAAPAPGLPRMESAAAAPGLPRMESPAVAPVSLPPLESVDTLPGLPVMAESAPRAEKPRPPSVRTPSQPGVAEVHARPASLWRRLLSFTIDTAAIAGVAALYITLASSVTGTKAPVAGLTGLDGFVAWLRALHTVLLPGFFLVLILALVYCAVAAFLWNGRTLGRLLLGLRLVDTHGLAPAPGRAIVRALLASVSFVLFLGGFWMALFDRRGQTLHDKLTSTFVVQPS
ncbi:RDD family protein [Myxococcus sp. CA040A]|nr:RDD family protein [Myxococcus sp. CA040A]